MSADANSQPPRAGAEAREARAPPRHGVRAAVTALAPLVGLCACRQDSVFTPIGPVSSAEGLILLDCLAVMLAIAIPTILACLAVAWWFRASNSKARRNPGFVYSGRVEMVVWSIPALTVLFLGGIAWTSSHDLDPAVPLKGSAPPVEVQVVSLDWKWLFIYPAQGVATVNRLVIPQGAPVHIRLTSASVMNTLFAPEIGSQLYAMNGMVGDVWWRADRPGVFPGRTSMISGDGYAKMAFEIDAVTPAQFAAWAATTKGAGARLDETEYRNLAHQSQDVKPYAYGAVAPGLFRDIVLQRTPPGLGPAQSGSHNADVRPQRSGS